MSAPRRFERWADAAAMATFVAVTAWLLDPVGRGTMPLSADHTVHLTRIHLWAGQLAAGHLRGFSPVWGFGVPVGEFYPILGDALVLALDLVLPGGLRTAYAYGFFAVYAGQAALVYAAARLCGVGRLGAATAGLAVLLDRGAYREGGFVYTVSYGVWPQALATPLCFVGVALVARFLRHGPHRARAGALAALAGGLAVLAHPMALPVLACLGGLAVLAVWADAPGDGPRVVARGTLVLALALGVAAFFLGPMLRYRGYMASYGWLGLPARAMIDALLRGQLAQHVVPAATGLALAGAAAAVFVRRPALRAVAAGTVVLWALATDALFWDLRLDRLSSAFGHVQHQRFLAVAKVGAYLLAGFAIDRIAAAGRLRWFARRPAAARVVATALAAAAAAAVLTGEIRALERLGRRGRVQTERLPGDPGAEAAFERLARAVGERFEHRDTFFRFAARAPRNAHDLADLPVESGAPVYKAGFVPGDNFVHKPESLRREVLDALAVRYVVERAPGGGRTDPPGTERFGPYRLRPRPGDPRPVAWLEGPGALVVEADDRFAPYVRGRIEGAGETTRIVFSVAGHPRFRLRMNGAEVPWVETPVFGDAPDVRPEDRLAGRVHGGKALGDDGSEPILIATPAKDGTFELTYEHATAFDHAMAAVSLAAFALVAFAWARPARAAAVLARLEHPLTARTAHAALWAILLAAGAALAGRYVTAARRQADHLHVLAADTPRLRARPGPVKADMWIRPAVLFFAAEDRPARLRVPVEVSGPYEGFVALDDDQALRRPNGRATVHLRALAGSTLLWEETIRVRHHPGSVPLALDLTGATALEVEVTATGTPPPVALDLWPEGAS